MGFRFALDRSKQVSDLFGLTREGGVLLVTLRTVGSAWPFATEESARRAILSLFACLCVCVHMSGSLFVRLVGTSSATSNTGAKLLGSRGPLVPWSLFKDCRILAHGFASGFPCSLTVTVRLAVFVTLELVLLLSLVWEAKPKTWPTHFGWLPDANRWSQVTLYLLSGLYAECIEVCAGNGTGFPVRPSLMQVRSGFT